MQGALQIPAACRFTEELEKNEGKQKESRNRWAIPHVEAGMVRWRWVG